MIIPEVQRPAPPRRSTTDLKDAEWHHIQGDIEIPQTGRGRRHTVCLRLVWNAIAYKLRTGCQWRLLPAEFPLDNTGGYSFRKWRNDGLLERVNDRLRRAVRQQAGRHQDPSGGVIDSQSAKAADRVGTMVGFAGGKKVKGRKRHVLVDTLGLLISTGRSRVQWFRSCKVLWFSPSIH